MVHIIGVLLGVSITSMIIFWIMRTSKGPIDHRTRALLWLVMALVVIGNIAGHLMVVEHSKWALAFTWSFAFAQIIILWVIARNF